jgi:hypothetical protein
VVRNDGSELTEKCREVMKVIDRQQVYNKLKIVLDTVNNYHHEVFITILNILAEIAPKEDNTVELSMLSFLKNYQRIRMPGQVRNQSVEKSIDVLKIERKHFFQVAAIVVQNVALKSKITNFVPSTSRKWYWKDAISALKFNSCSRSILKSLSNGILKICPVLVTIKKESSDRNVAMNNLSPESSPTHDMKPPLNYIARDGSVECILAENAVKFVVAIE